MSHLETQSATLVEEVPAETQAMSFLHSLSSQTPWWVVSALFHGLTIVLVGLISMNMNLNVDDEPMIVISDPPVRVTFKKQEEVKPQKVDERSGLVPADYNPSRPEQPIYITEEFKRIAVEGDHIEMITRDLTGNEIGIRGTEEGKAVFLTDKPTEEPGGSGGGGASFVENLAIGSGVLNAGSGGGDLFGNGFGKGIQDGLGKGLWGKRDKYGRKNMFERYNPRSTGPGWVKVPDYKTYCRDLEDALAWLAKHQEPDGHWDTKKYGADHKCDTAMTGLALLAFLGWGESEKVGEHKANIKLAVNWLISKQKENGFVADDTDDGAPHRRGGYPMAIATMALAEAAGMGNIPATRVAAQKAVDYCVNIHQAGEGSDKLGWRYAPKSEGDLSVSGWFIMALKSAKVAGLHVDPAAFDGAQRFLETVEIKDKSLDTGYGPVSRFKYMSNNEHAGTAHRLTAIGTLCRVFMGWKPEELQGSVEWFIAKGGLPEYGGNGEKCDLYYWYYASMAVYQQDETLFKKWSVAMLNALLPNQRSQGDDNGSWDPAGDYSGEWGRVGQTALSTLCLEVYFRNDRVNRK
ncbi:MAG TPA: prenyltransferase/squalene oxidase repeat-containing protein [Planctomycetota bacterium]|nr:prenyltransferase/squalene oxidase repeat-containing protein [Planctomycetota bacterium]